MNNFTTVGKVILTASNGNAPDVNASEHVIGYREVSLDSVALQRSHVHSRAFPFRKSHMHTALSLLLVASIKGADYPSDFYIQWSRHFSLCPCGIHCWPYRTLPPQTRSNGKLQMLPQITQPAPYLSLWPLTRRSYQHPLLLRSLRLVRKQPQIQSPLRRLQTWQRLPMLRERFPASLPPPCRIWLSLRMLLQLFSASPSLQPSSRAKPLFLEKQVLLSSHIHLRHRSHQSQFDFHLHADVNLTWKSNGHSSWCFFKLHNHHFIHRYDTTAA